MFRAFSRRRHEMNQTPITSIQVELTNHCNYKCRVCPQSKWGHSEASDTLYDRAKGYMSFDLFRKIVDEANEISGQLNFSFFGEPMMHPDFLKFMDYLKGRNQELDVVMNTNLSFATKEIFQKLIEINLTELRISIDAATQKTYDVVRAGKGCVDLDGASAHANRFDVICEKAEFWFQLPDHRPTRHVFTVSETNLPELELYVKRWLPVLGENDTILCKNVLTYGGKMRDSLVRENPCNVWESDMLTVDWTGRVSPCNLDVNMAMTIGLATEESLLTIHKGKKRRQMERLSKMKKIAACKHCIDGNNWSRNIVFRKGDDWTSECLKIYENFDRKNDTRFDKSLFGKPEETTF